MNFGNIFKGVAQPLVNAALPAVRAELKSLAAGIILRTVTNTDEQAATINKINAALDAWTIKL